MSSSQPVHKTSPAYSDQVEIDNFSKLAETWWDPEGPFKTLHLFNPVRLSYIREKIIQHFSLDKDSFSPFSSLNILDIGCGGGLVSEPMARLGAKMTSIDAVEKNVKIAQAHAKDMGLKIDYNYGSLELFEGKKDLFDVILCLEVVEHVSDLASFLKDCAKLLKPNGLIFCATINRTAKSMFFAKIGAEYILRWLPIGTHQWSKFVKPSELVGYLRDNNIETQNTIGVEFNLFTQKWNQTRSLDVNYMLHAIKA